MTEESYRTREGLVVFALVVNTLRESLRIDLGWSEDAAGVFRIVCAGLLAVLLPIFTVLLVRRIKDYRRVGDVPRAIIATVYMTLEYVYIAVTATGYVYYDLLPYLGRV